MRSSSQANSGPTSKADIDQSPATGHEPPTKFWQHHAILFRQGPATRHASAFFTSNESSHRPHWGRRSADTRYLRDGRQSGCCVRQAAEAEMALALLGQPGMLRFFSKTCDIGLKNATNKVLSTMGWLEALSSTPLETKPAVGGCFWLFGGFETTRIGKCRRRQASLLRIRLHVSGMEYYRNRFERATALRSLMRHGEVRFT